MENVYAGTVLVYFAILIGIGVWSSRRIQTEEDFIIAGRRLPVWMATATLFATWFGAGTLLTSADEVHQEGLFVASMEPYGAGVCLLLAGLFIAAPLWRMKILTLADLFRLKFGKRAELTSIILVVPGFIGWIAVQLVASAGVLHAFFEIDLTTGILLMAAIATLYTLLGGMWSVTMTDLLQMVFLVIGVVALGYEVIATLVDGESAQSFLEVWRSEPEERRTLIPSSNVGELFGWLNLFCIAALGNLPGQDLTQRIFASKSARTAQVACGMAGVLYIVLGTVPVVVGLFAGRLLPEGTQDFVIPLLAKALLSPFVSVVFFLGVVSVLLSTLDSAILAVSTTIAHNVLKPRSKGKVSPIRLNQMCIPIVAGISTIVAFLGEDTYSLLEASYASTMVALLVPMLFCLNKTKSHEGAALSAMVVGVAVWTLEFWLLPELPMALIATSIAALVFVGVSWVAKRGLVKNEALG